MEKHGLPESSDKRSADDVPVLLRESEIVAMMGHMHASTFRRLIRDGRFPPGTFISPRIRVWRAEIVYAAIKKLLGPDAPPDQP